MVVEVTEYSSIKVAASLSIVVWMQLLCSLLN